MKPSIRDGAIAAVIAFVIYEIVSSAGGSGFVLGAGLVVALITFVISAAIAYTIRTVIGRARPTS